jgi:hypothetical protein
MVLYCILLFALLVYLVILLLRETKAFPTLLLIVSIIGFGGILIKSLEFVYPAI